MNYMNTINYYWY